MRIVMVNDPTTPPPPWHSGGGAVDELRGLPSAPDPTPDPLPIADDPPWWEALIRAAESVWRYNTGMFYG